MQGYNKDLSNSRVYRGGRDQQNYGGNQRPMRNGYGNGPRQENLQRENNRRDDYRPRGTSNERYQNNNYQKPYRQNRNRRDE